MLTKCSNFVLSVIPGGSLIASDDEQVAGYYDDSDDELVRANK